ncbi:10026_t:CDS:2, partial [Funneliformis geosporum]
LDNDEQVAKRLSSKIGKPEAFNKMTNAFKICQWLIIKRPDILTIENQMYHALNTSLDSSFVINMTTAIS